MKKNKYIKQKRIIPFSGVIILLSADNIASAIATPFRGEQVKCFVASVSHTADGGMMLPTAPDCTAFSLGLME